MVRFLYSQSLIKWEQTYYLWLGWNAFSCASHYVIWHLGAIFYPPMVKPTHVGLRERNREQYSLWSFWFLPTMATEVMLSKAYGHLVTYKVFPAVLLPFPLSVQQNTFPNGTVAKKAALPQLPLSSNAVPTANWGRKQLQLLWIYSASPNKEQHGEWENIKEHLLHLAQQNWAALGP